VNTTAEGTAIAYAGFRRAAWGALAYNVLVVLWGALVRATTSGAGCGGHWPLCNGALVPSFAGAATIIEYTHRVMSGLALAAVFGLWLWSRRLFPQRHRVRRAATLSFGFLVLEALFGAGLVLFGYVAHNASLGRALILAAHLANTQVLLATLFMTAWLVTRGDAPLAVSRLPKSLLVALPLVVVLSMTGVVVALGDTLFPAPSPAPFLLRLRIIHPLFAVIVGLCLFYAASSAVRARSSRAVRRGAAAVAALTVAQLVAGALNVALLAPVWLQLVHLLLADLVWISLVLLTASVAVE
jgi:heme A synthase